ncbi:MAG: DUF2079 domain-containing protein [Vulcanimicrobiota bacterium]
MSEKRAYKLLALLMGLYTAAFSWLALERHWRMQTSIFDLGIFDQALYLLTQDDSLFLTTRGLHVHGDHFHPILLLFAPLYLLSPSVTTLLVLQTLVIAAGAYPAYRLARHHGLEARWSLVVAGVYLAHPAVGFLNRFDFHPVAVMAPALLFAVLYLEEAKPIPYTLALLATLACTEAAGFTVIALAVTALWVRDKRWFLGTFTLGALGIVVAKYWLRYFNHDQSSPYAMLYTNYGTSEAEVALHLLSQPLNTVASLSTPLNFEYLFYLFGPVLFLPLLAPDRLLPILPVLLGNLLSWRYSQHRIENHYGAALAPILIWAAVVGWKRLQTRGVSEKVLGTLLSVAFLSCVYFGPLGVKHRSRLNPRASLENVKQQVHPDDVVVADNALGGHFSQRERLFLFPNPFVRVAWGNTSGSLVQQSSNEYRPVSRGAVRRGLEAVSLDCIVLPIDSEMRSDFPLLPGDSSMIRAEVERSPLWEKVEPVEGDAFVLRRRAKP